MTREKKIKAKSAESGFAGARMILYEPAVWNGDAAIRLWSIFCMWAGNWSKMGRSWGAKLVAASRHVRNNDLGVKRIEITSPEYRCSNHRKRISIRKLSLRAIYIRKLSVPWCEYLRHATPYWEYSSLLHRILAHHRDLCRLQCAIIEAYWMITGL